MNPLKPLLLTLATWACLQSALPAQAYYAAEFGRWINRDPIGENGFEELHADGGAISLQNAYAFVKNVPIGNVDWYGLKAGGLLELGAPTSSGGDILTCTLVSRTAPISGSPSHNGQEACIFRCGMIGPSSPPLKPPLTIGVVTFAKPGKKCPPPDDPCNGGSAYVFPGAPPPYLIPPVYE